MSVIRNKPGIRLEQRCRGCGCTENDACLNSCSWIEPDLCSTCDKAIADQVEYFDYSRRPNRAFLRREVDARLLLRRKSLRLVAGGGNGRP